MANRHKFKKGGRVAYTGADSHVEHEAVEKKHGGKVVSMHGHAGKKRYKRGGKVGANTHPFSTAFRGPSGE